MADEKLIENSLNELIAKATANGGHVYVVDKKRNDFALKLTEPITIHYFAVKGDTHEEKDQ